MGATVADAGAVAADVGGRGVEGRSSLAFGVLGATETLPALSVAIV